MTPLATAIKFARLRNQMIKEARKCRNNPQGKQDRMKQWEAYHIRVLIALGRLN